MQDNTPGHTAQYTREELGLRDISIIFWPLFSPGLNPIETVWDIIKDYIQDYYKEKLSYDKLRIAVKTAWDMITEDKLAELLYTMHKRCETVIAANGMHTKY
jgi:hypothetical protein